MVPVICLDGSETPALGPTRPSSRLDRFCSRLAHRQPQFQGGWGQVEAFRWPRPEQACSLEWTRLRSFPWGQWRGGRFRSPAVGLPPESAWATVELWLPPGADFQTPLVLHFAATGDQGFLRRRLLTLPLLEAGVGALLLESPYYGRRRPQGQSGTKLRTVADLLKLIAASVCEGLALLRGLEDAGHQRLGVCGISRGGQVAALTAALYPRPVALAAVVAAHSASVVFTQGVMENDCDWEALGGRQEAQPRLSRCLEATDIRAFSSPVRPDAAVLVGSLWDAYIPPWSIQTLHQALPGSVLRWLPTGHIGSLLFHPRSLARAVAESFLRLEGA